ncbi:HalOD1 output domain-containing protein [Halostella pelagica]|uniref:HalOD1 output domain-containing protein n=1 Tax=Halostella pelagica TaxID=2583824 RepID=UPI0010813F40|nr:HalOD1 output domain-containing protein [Halostella pelagica]
MLDASPSEDPPRPSTWIVEALADAVDIDPVALHPPLYDVIDLDTLDRLFGSGNVTTVEFEYHGTAVTVREDEIVVDGTAYEP